MQFAVVLGRDTLRPVGARALREDGPSRGAQHLPARERVGEAVEVAAQERLVGEGGRHGDDKEGEERGVERADEVDVGRRSGRGVGVVPDRERHASRQRGHVWRVHCYRSEQPGRAGVVVSSGTRGGCRGAEEGRRAAARVGGRRGGDADAGERLGVGDRVGLANADPGRAGARDRGREGALGKARGSRCSLSLSGRRGRGSPSVAIGEDGRRRQATHVHLNRAPCRCRVEACTSSGGGARREATRRGASPRWTGTGG